MAVKDCLAYAVWMVLMLTLPATATGYAIRTAATAAVLLGTFGFGWARKIRLADLGWGALVGLAVLLVWIAPEHWPLYQKYGILRLFGSGTGDSVAQSGTALLVVRLIGSAFVISVAEELFFRRWLIPFAGLGWSVALFAVEHDRYLVGAIAGLAYGLLYLRRGLGASIAAHAVTNLLLGFYVIHSGEWGLW